MSSFDVMLADQLPLSLVLFLCIISKIHVPHQQPGAFILFFILAENYIT